MTTRHQVTLISALAETPCPVGSLISATAEPPFCGESVVLDAAGRCLAQAIDVGRGEDGRTRWAWAVSGIGCQRLECEARGTLAGAA